MNILRMDGDRGAPVVRSEPQPNALGLIKVTSKTGRLGWGRIGGEQQSGPRQVYGSPTIRIKKAKNQQIYRTDLYHMDLMLYNLDYQQKIIEILFS